MLLSLAIIFLAGMFAAAVFERIGLPRIIGMLAVGILASPYVFDLLDDSVLGISTELRQITLIIILLRAGLSLDLFDLRKVGRPALMMAFVPASFEIAGYIIFAPMLLGISHTEAALMGAVLGAVSPAVVVPRMVRLMDESYGTEKAVPQMLLAGASCDDVFVIVLFSTFLNMAQKGRSDVSGLMDIPVSIIIGVLMGAAVGFCMYHVSGLIYRNSSRVHSTAKVVVMLGISFMLMSAEKYAKPYIAISGLLAVVAMACVIKKMADREVSAKLSDRFGQLWYTAEIVLFVLVGAAVDVRYTLSAGLSALIMIFIALVFRAAGVFVCMIKTRLNAKEKLFCIIAYLPKATVQAAIGSIPLSAGLSCGKIVLSVAVMGILLTAPLGAIGIDKSYRRLLEKA